MIIRRSANVRARGAVTTALFSLVLLSSGALPAPASAASSTPSPTNAASAAPAGRSTVGGPLLSRTGFIVEPLAGATPLPTAAKAPTTWLLADLDTGAILAARDPHRRLYPASTLKTLTAETLIPRLSPQLVYRATFQDASAEGSRVGIVEESSYTVEQLFTGLFLNSGNDAASALANAYGGIPKTVAEMAAEARRLQALDTTVVNPSGLDALNQRSSSYDLALFARAGLELPDFAKYAATLSADFPGKEPTPTSAASGPAKPTVTAKPTGSAKPTAPVRRTTFKIFNQNKLLSQYRGAFGVKTGYTTLGGRTYIGAAERDGRRLMFVMMQDTQATYPVAEAMLDWGFANATKLKPVGMLVDPVSLTPTPTQITPSGSPGAAGGGANAEGQVAGPANLSSPAVSTAGIVGGAAGALVLLAGGTWWLRRRSSSRRQLMLGRIPGAGLYSGRYRR